MGDNSITYILSKDYFNHNTNIKHEFKQQNSITNFDNTFCLNIDMYLQHFVVFNTHHITQERFNAATIALVVTRVICVINQMKFTHVDSQCYHSTNSPTPQQRSLLFTKQKIKIPIYCHLQQKKPFKA